MDIGGVEHRGHLAQQKTSWTEDKHRLPLLPSKKNNDISATCKPKNVASRYKSGISSTPVLTPSSPRRHPSPNASHTSPAPAVSLPKRPQSAERRRPTTPSSRFSAPSSPSSSSTPSSPSSRSTTPAHDMVAEIHSTTWRLLSNRTPDGLWPSMRSLSSSFQSESPIISVSKKEKVVVNSSEKTIKSPANIVIERKRTPLRGRNSSDQSENSKPLDNSNARVIDQCRWPGILGGRSSANGLSRSVDLSDRSSRSASLTVASRGVSPKRTNPSSDSATRVPQPSLSEVTARVFNDGGGRAEQCVKSVVKSSSQISMRYSSVTRSNKTQSSPVPGLRSLSSPSKVLSTSTSSYTARGMSSPSRTRPSTPVSSSSNVTSRMVGTSSVLNYSVDVRKGKKNRNHIEDAHQLKLLYNANLRWCFVNARADKTLLVQKMKTENVLHSVWNRISKLHDPVILKRIDVQRLQLEMKLRIILKEQMAYLERWVALEREHCSSLSGAVEALNASTLRLPITGGAKAAVVDVKNAVSSAVDVMQAMGSSIAHLLSKVEGTKSLVSELSTIAAREKSMLDDCRDLLASTAAMQVQESSLRTHIIQLKQDAHEPD
ncbi:AUGMIN subunit 8-like [Musa acuminata AAA Group]|uniref:AUGMIN subunit 8-like n=2 Tax=Musa acuminata AAA Group TaxID=214697 RepID=UPI0031DC5757